MNIFYVTIGRYTRRGTFETLVSKAIAAPDGTEKGTVLSHFQKQYGGFDVNAQDVPLLVFEQEVPPQPPASVPKPPERPIPYLTNIQVELTDEERTVSEDYKKHLNGYRNAREKLTYLVRERYRKLSYVGETNTASIEIEIDRFGCVEIKKLPIRVRELYQSALDGTDGTEGK